MKELILGGVRSGKSRLAEQYAEQSDLEVIYIATATGKSDDSGFTQRINTHRDRRPVAWLTVEEPIQLAKVLLEHDGANKCILVDCLTLWLTNLLCAENDKQAESEIQSFLSVIPQLKSRIILVSNESGLGITPMGQLSRDYLDKMGELHQQLAEICDRVTMCIAGLPMILKSDGLQTQEVNQ